MLVFTRKPKEIAVIKLGGQLVKVHVVEIVGDKVKLGFEADRDIAIDRLEIWQAKNGGSNGPTN